ncbi:retrovirus-related pol polyprotein from transposon TNT 1-94 [Tanacetum coccineum]
MYKLKKALYGLKQALRAWYDLLSSYLLSQKFSKGAMDPTLFIRREGKDILLICPRLPNQEFVVDPSFDLEIISFIKELGYICDIDSVTKVYTDHMHQPWRTYVAVINRCLSGKTTGLDKIRLSRAQILWEMYFNQNVDFIELIWEDFMFQTDNRDSKKQEKIYYPRFTKTEKSKGIELLSEAAILEEAQLQKAIKRIKQETEIHQAGGLSKGASLEPEGDSDDDDDDDQQGNDERTESNNDKDVYINKTYKEEEDRFVHTPNDYVPTDDENIDDEEYDRINKEMHSDVNVELKDIELEGEGKDDKEMTDVGRVDAEHENVNQEVVGDLVKDVDQATVTAAPATKKIEVPLPISSMSSDYATKFLNFDNIPSAKIGIIFNYGPSKSTHEDQKTTISTTSAPDSSTLTAIHQRLSDLENEVKPLRNVDHSSTIHTTIKSEVPTVVKEYLGTNLDGTLHKVIQRHTAELIKEHSVLADVIEILQ